MRTHLFLIIIGMVSFSAPGQKSLEAVRISEKIVIDGSFSEQSWEKAPLAADFIQYKPQPGTPSTQRTDVRVLYDDHAIYIAARCYDKPEHVSRVLSLRDDFNANVDNFQVYFDTYNDDLNAFAFGVSSMGVQYDAKQFSSSESPELNMVWSSAVQITNEGWQAEMRIPYSAFRFPKKDIQDWGINFFRYISRNREESVWSPINPDFDNWPAQYGTLTGVQGIEPPLRLAFMPYVSAYADHYPLNPNGSGNWSGSFNGGMDIKLGLNEAFTLDMTLVPDFGQVVFDNQVLNLSPFEIQFNENRQFFTEGTELFNKSGLFYSRRIGIQSPYAVLNTNLQTDEYLKNVPGSSQLYNASKVSGRTRSGLGIGVFNGITAEQSATAVNVNTGSERSIVVSPLTNYNVIVLDQNLRNNSYITLTNTNVWREGHFYDANVTGVITKMNTRNNKYFLSGRTAFSDRFGSISQNSDGYNAGISLGKQTGNLIFQTGYFQESDTYDPNDLGFNANNNKRILDASVSYRIFKPFWKINQCAATMSMSYNRLYAPDVYTATYLNFNFFNVSKRFNASGLKINSSLTDSYDYFEPRAAGRYFVRPKWLDAGIWISSNYQKRFALDASVNAVVTSVEDWKNYGYSISPRWRVSDKIFLIYQWEQSLSLKEQGYAVVFGIPAQTSGGIVFGTRNRVNSTNTINLRYTLTNRMGITFRLRHYRSVITYDRFFDLQEDGTLALNSMDGLDVSGISAYNTNFNAFTIDFVYRWVFLPGSEINIVWKNSIFSSNKAVTDTYLMNLTGLLNEAPLNSFSLKILYWLDYQSLKRKKQTSVR